MSTKIYEAMAAIMKATDAIGKDQKNAQQGFQYRGIDDVYNSMHRILAEHGVFMTPEVLEKTREERTNKNGTVLAFTTLRIKYTFWAEDGSSVSCTVEGEGMDSGDKSSNKAMAVAHKYALLQTFCIPTAETKDPDAECHEVSARNSSRTAAKTSPPAKGDADREHYKIIAGELKGALTIADVNGIIANRKAWIDAMPEEGRIALNDMAMDILAKMEAA